MQKSEGRRQKAEVHVRTAVLTSAFCLLPSDLHAGIQSIADPRGPQAGAIASLWWIFFWVCVAVYVIVIAVLLIALVRARKNVATDFSPSIDGLRPVTTWVAVATAVTALILIGLLTASVATGRAVGTFGQDKPDQLEVQVIGHQWWWEVTYNDPQPSKMFRTANEIHIPVGKPVLLRLSTQDVIHSLWIPNLHGKRDLIPGRYNKFWIQADTPGIYRGQCAEFCGMQHAHMALVVFAEKPEDFERWKARQQTPAIEPQNADQMKGQQLFLSLPCVNCHSIVGTDAYATVGPDLTHVAGRRTLGAGLLMNNRGNMSGWLLNAPAVKPGVLMPPHPMNSNELLPLVAYLESLK
jgi:cytochrome c oxidase subunit 2